MGVGAYIRKQNDKRKQKLQTLASFTLGIFFMGALCLAGKTDMEAEAGVYRQEAVLVGFEDGKYIFETEGGKQYKVQDPPEIIFELTIQNGEVVEIKEAN